VLLILILTSTILTISFLPHVRAETEIVSLTPSDGYVGTSAQLVANISTVNGTYVIQFDEENVTSGMATGNNVNASFNIPHASEGDHYVRIIDVTAGENSTAIFTISALYTVTPILPESPALLQEGANVTFSINMTGGPSNYTYPNATVQTPYESIVYEASRNITTTLTGDFYDNFSYPNDFSVGANTNFTGEYQIIFNETIVSQFSIGVTNSSQYHRGDIVNVKTVDYYPPNENVTLNITLGSTLIDSLNYSAIDGVINENWTVPLNATIGQYNMSITPVPNSKKNASDTQIFTVPGYNMSIFTLNLANKTVPNIFVNAYDVAENAYYNVTSGADGLAVSMLEVGNYTCEAFFNDVRVGEINFTVNKEEQLNFTCQLTTLNISVVDAQNISIPNVSISLGYNYTTNFGTKENRTGQDSGVTDINGTLQLYALLPNVTYMMNASRYGEIFNQGNDTLSNLPTEAYFDAVILCPVRTLRVNIVDGQNQSITNVTVDVRELMGGLNYANNTDINGLAVLNCTLGRYMIKVYLNEILLSETYIELLQNQNLSIICGIYGLNVSVKVVDYFGQPISNVNVTLQREGLETRSFLTQSGGTVTFDNIIGGDLQIAACLSGQTQPSVVSGFYVDKSSTLQIKIENYVTLAGFLVETSQLVTAIIIVVSVILILLVEVYRKKRPTPQKSES
jgi:hypothetical protein